jgi:hypothetical protein
MKIIKHIFDLNEVEHKNNLDPKTNEEVEQARANFYDDEDIPTNDLLTKIEELLMMIDS